MTLFKRFGWGSTDTSVPPDDFEARVLRGAEEATACAVAAAMEDAVEDEIDFASFIASADVVGLARRLYPSPERYDSDSDEEDDPACVPCVGGAILLTYSRYSLVMGLPPIPCKVTPTPMPMDEVLETFFSWLLRLANRVDGHTSGQKRNRRRARELANVVIRRNDLGQFQISWSAAEEALPASLFARIRDHVE